MIGSSGPSLTDAPSDYAEPSARGPKTFTVYPEENTAAARAARDKHYGDFDSAVVAAQRIAAEMGRPVDIAGFDDDGNHVGTWEIRPDFALPIYHGCPEERSPLLDAAADLLEAVEGLLKHMDMSKVTVRNGFSLLVAHNAARKAVDKARGIRHVPELLPAAEPTGGCRMSTTRTFVIPTSDPIHLYGEADAYPGETYDNAWGRLWCTACECGFMASRTAADGGCSVRVYNIPHHAREYRLRFDPATDTLAGVDARSARVSAGVSDEWKQVWSA